jgi:hypothetical protein
MLGKVQRLWNRLGGLSNLGFAVWVVYGFLCAFDHWTAAVVAGLAIMLAIVAGERRTANLKIIDLTSLGFPAVQSAIVRLDFLFPAIEPSQVLLVALQSPKAF